MKVYVGQTRSTKLIPRLTALGFGECVQRYEMGPRRKPYFIDNGAFGDWRSGAPFNEREFQEAVALSQYYDLYLGEEYAPDFVVVPDIVAGGVKSLEFSLQFVPWLEDRGPLYLVLQDGMQPSDVKPHLSLFQGLFVGGTVPWKVRTGEQWVRFAHSHHLPCHIGRVGTARRVTWALRIGADSIDSCLPLWCEEYLQKFVFALEGRQPELFA